jgi:CheY-like chemotaxis protein
MTHPTNDARPVLVVDDNEDVRDALALVLQGEGFAVDTAKDGRDALARLHEQPQPCLVILDLHMPEFDGRAFRAAQRADSGLMRIPVILFSGEHDLAAAASSMGIEAYFKKPFDPEAIVALVRRYATGA